MIFENIFFNSAHNNLTSPINACERKAVYEKVKGGYRMGVKKMNKAISCSVNTCKFNCSCADGEYCTLDNIRIGTHESNPTVMECTDCKSFILK